MKKLSVLLLALALTIPSCASVVTEAPSSNTTQIINETVKENQEVINPQILFEQAVRDAVFAEESEIQPLVTLTKEDQYVTWNEEGKVLLCTWHNYPDSYPEGETVEIAWGPVWTFANKELATHADEFKEAEDSEMRFKQLICFAPDSKHSTVTGLWVDPADIYRPAYQNDPTKPNMTTTFSEDIDEEFKAWFDTNILNSYFYGAYPWTRLGYTYDWANNGKTYGLTEFIIKSGAKVEVAFTETTDDFLKKISQEVQS